MDCVGHKGKKRPFSGHINVDYSNVMVHASDEKKKLPPVGLDLMITASRVMKVSNSARGEGTRGQWCKSAMLQEQAPGCKSAKVHEYNCIKPLVAILTTLVTLYLL